ncbi:unnamed protein product [Acanthoscelides obtectus]|uniref:CCD97-like C-terminal domain-containing protein n=1 Tax=Acanthoscelides obtectus TaxID=200917 RepID=A0A9P0NU52_ACAOB|nr:unnamed protein product [Acanthoscelides obtectus]CAK1665847.1 Coiled-coil domain-containing protein 97 [Acanthoscelides obtectus]
MTMEVEDPSSDDQTVESDMQRDSILNFLTLNEEICFKNQQKWEPDLTTKEKYDIALNVFRNSKLNFLLRFGKYLNQEHLTYFRRFTEHGEPDCAEIELVLGDLSKICSSNSNNKLVKNRRYEAMKQMIQDDLYFSEIEMMKRNPLLYEQLVGQYLTDDEIRERDKYKMDDQVTFVKILMEGIERDNAEAYRKLQAESEDNQMEEEDSDDDEDEEDRERKNTPSPIPSCSKWGEFDVKDEYHVPRSGPKRPQHCTAITAQERLLLREEFVSSMYQSFLDGKDDFDYRRIDNDSSLDNADELDHDAEDKYFESEEAEECDMQREDESSEDEFDMFMNHINQHPAVSELTRNMKNSNI